jgi:ATP-binding cassette subfamily B multidrug efflux pump
MTDRTQLTDMAVIDSTITETKAEFLRLRKSKRPALYREANFDEDGTPRKKAFDWQIMRRLLGYLGPYRKQLTAGLALLIGYSALTPIFPSLIARAVDRYIVAESVPFNAFTDEARFKGLMTIVVIYLVLRLVNFGLRYGYTYLITWLGQHIIYDLRKAMFTKIQHLHLGFFDRTPVGRLITRITSDVDAIEGLMTNGVIGLIADVGLLLGLTIFMFIINWQLAIVTLAIMPLLFLTLNWLRSRIRDAHRVVRLRVSRSTAYLAENLNGMSTVQLFNREERNKKRFDHLNLDLIDARVEMIRWYSLFWPAVQITGGIATALILYFGALNLIGPGFTDTITLGVLIAFIQYSAMFFRPLQDLSDKYNIVQAAMASSERIFDLLDTPEKVTNRPDPVSFNSPFQGEVAFEDVWFAYQDTDWVIRGISLKISPGESVAFVGHTGAGKTTIISLISRFYDVQKGTVKIDGKDVRDYNQIDLRHHIGIVLQDPFLFSGTILSNITLNDDTMPREKAIEAAKFVNAHGFIDRLPGGYDTVVRERGAGFSTGQKQLIAFARALVQNPDILLVLDEATANIDTETEELIQDALKKLMQGRTSILIAHRLSTIQDVDRIMVMSNGNLIEEGNHFDLLKKSGHYRKLYELQYRDKQE